MFLPLPTLVQSAIIECMKKICGHDKNPKRQAQAQLVYATLLVNGMGVSADLQLAASHMLSAAKAGIKRAQMLYLQGLCQVSSAKKVEEHEEVEWQRTDAVLGSRSALRRLKLLSEQDYQQCLHSFRMNETFDRASRESENSSVCEDLEKSGWQKACLRFAIIHNMPDLAESMVASKSGLTNEMFSNGETPLILASRLGYLSMMLMLLREGANPRIASPDGVTALHWLVVFEEEEKIPACAALIAKGADTSAMVTKAKNATSLPIRFDTTCVGSPLYWAIFENDLAAVKALIHYDADPLVSVGAQTGLDTACFYTRSDILHFLLGNPRAAKDVDQYRGDQIASFKPMYWVLRTRHRFERLQFCGPDFERETEDCLKLLVKHGASPHSIHKFGQAEMTAIFCINENRCDADVMRTALRLGLGVDVNSRFSPVVDGSILMQAVQHEDRDAFDALLAAGVDVTAQDSRGCNALQVAAELSDDIYFSQRLLESGIDLEHSTPRADRAFAIAVRGGNYKVAKYLFDKGADRDLISNYSPTTILGQMLLLKTANSARRVEFLLSLPDKRSDGFVVEHEDGHPFSAYFHAAFDTTEDSKSNEITKIMTFLLLDKYDEPQYINWASGAYHRTALHLATTNGNWRVVRALCEAGAKSNAQDGYRCTPLDWAYRRRDYPYMIPAFDEIKDLSDKLLVARVRAYVEGNTDEILIILKSYEARINTYDLSGSAGLVRHQRSIDWLIENLKRWRSEKAEMAREGDLVHYNALLGWKSYVDLIQGRNSMETDK